MERGWTLQQKERQKGVQSWLPWASIFGEKGEKRRESKVEVFGS